MKNRWKVIAAVMSIVLMLCACAAKTDTDKKDPKEESKEVVQIQPGEKEKDYQAKLDTIEPAAYRNASGLNLEPGSYISIIGKSEAGQFWQEVKKGAEQAAADINEQLGYKGKDAVKVTYSGPGTENNVDEQVNILDEELARYPVALGISIADTQACEVQFDLAGEGDIPIVAFDSGSDYPGLGANVSTDNRASAQLAADKLAELMGEEGEVIIFVQDSTSQSAKERENGFVEQLQSEHPNIKVAATYRMDQLQEMQQVIAQEKGEKAPEEVTQEDVVAYLLEKCPNVKGCFATNSDTIKLALKVLKENEVSPFIVGYDGDTEELDALKAGKIDGLIVQNPFAMGYASVIASARAALSMGNEAFVNTGFTWVTKENLKSEEVQKILY